MDTLDLIKADDANHEFEDKLMLYGQFVGEWSVKSYWYNDDGTTTTAEGTWHFDWILGGRGIQDVLYASEFVKDQYGTTIRCYDSEHDLWRVTWMLPSQNEFTNLIARQVGNDIVQENIDKSGKKQIWRFTEIKAKSFVWRDEVSYDDGQTWKIVQEMICKRVKNS